MGSVRQARLNNARRVGERIKGLIEEGHLVIDDEGEVVRTVRFEGFRGNGGLCIDQVVWMDDDPTGDNGLELTIAEFNAQFAGWKAIHPKHFRRVA